MAAIPYMPLYIADYMADAAHLSTLEHGAYLLLIMTYWQRGRCLPSSNERLANVARMSSEQWETVRPTLSEFFQERDGCWFHKRIEKELEHFRTVSEHNRRGGLASGESRRKKSNERSANAAKSFQKIANERSTNGDKTLNHTDGDGDGDGDGFSVVENLPTQKHNGRTDEAQKKPPSEHRNGSEARNGSVRPSETLNPERIEFVRSSLYSYMRMEGTSFARQFKPPDDAIVLRCLNAIGNSDLSDVGSYLRELFVEKEQSPRHASGPRKYAWFESVLAEKFHGGNT